MNALKPFSLVQTKQKINRKFAVNYKAMVHVLQGPVMKVFAGREKWQIARFRNFLGLEVGTTSRYLLQV
jgi:hypothetical protein